jgi:nucleotide-binding universal stress UspA family protein
MNGMLDIKIYGTGTPSYQLAKTKLTEALQNANISYKLQEITNVEEIIRDHVDSVPAVCVNDRHLFQMKPNGQYNKTLRETIQKVLQLGKYGSMKKIIVPTDFSDASFTAYNFANSLARKINAVLLLTHVYHPVSTDIQQLVAVNEEAERVREDKLQGFVSSLNQDWIGNFITEPLVEGVFRVGFPRMELKDLSRLENALMVMGTTGEGGLLKKYFGSLSLDMMKEVHCPLFLVPPLATYQDMSRVIFFSEDLSSDSNHLLYVAGLAVAMECPLSLMHFSVHGEEYNLQDTLNLIQRFYPELEFVIDVVDTNQVITSLDEFLQDQNKYLLVLSTGHKNLFEKFFHRSISDYTVIHSHCPVLVLNQHFRESERHGFYPLSS